MRDNKKDRLLNLIFLPAFLSSTSDVEAVAAAAAAMFLAVRLTTPALATLSSSSLRPSLSPFRRRFSSESILMVSVMLRSFCISSLLRFGRADEEEKAVRPFKDPELEAPRWYGEPGPAPPAPAPATLFVPPASTPECPEVEMDRVSWKRQEGKAC